MICTCLCKLIAPAGFQDCELMLGQQGKKTEQREGERRSPGKDRRKQGVREAVVAKANPKR